MKLIFLNRYFHPDASATSQMLSDLAFHLASQGAKVHVITSRQRYDDASAGLAALEHSRGVTIHRVPTTRFGRSWLPGRALDYLSFYATSAFALIGLARKGDVVIAKTDPPLLGVPAGMVARLRGARLVNWLQDVFPEIASRTGLRFAQGLPGTVIRALRNWSLRAATCNVVLGDRMHTELRSLPGLASTNFRVIHNWADGEACMPRADGAPSLRSAWDLAGKFVVAYSGNMGRAHEFDTILTAAEQLRERKDVVFLFIGGGHQLQWLMRQASERKLSNIRFQPYQPRERLGESLGLADVHLTCLQPALEGLMVPSKIYGILASGRATLHVGDPDGEIASILGEARAGYTVRVGDAEGLARRIEALKADPVLRATLGANARAAFDTHYASGIAFARWAEVLRTASGRRPA